MKHTGMLVALILGCSLSGLTVSSHASHGGHAGGGGRGGGHVAGGAGGFHGGFHGGGFHGRTGHAVFVGGPLFFSTYGVWPSYFDSYPPYADIPAAPPVYFENGAGDSGQPPVSSWYYCQNPPGYYPYVQQCPSGWQRVSPQAPPPGSY
jgi:hypothetical protein